MLKDVVWFPRLPCRLLSTGAIRRDGGEYIDSGLQRSYIRPEKGGSKITLPKKKGFLTLSAVVKARVSSQASAHASFANKSQPLALKDWHNVLGHIDPAALKHLEKQGFIEITDATVASDM